MANLLGKIRQLIEAVFSKKSSALSNGKVETAVPEWRLTEESAVRLLRLLEITTEGMLTCAETFDLLDEYAETVQSGEEAEILLPLVKHHLDNCPECYHRYVALQRVLQTNPDPI